MDAKILLTGTHTSVQWSNTQESVFGHAGHSFSGLYTKIFLVRALKAALLGVGAYHGVNSKVSGKKRRERIQITAGIEEE